MYDPVFAVRMSHQLVCEFHIRDSWLVCAGACLLERREAMKQFLYHLRIVFFGKNFRHKREKRLL
jgi:hypothetical protein